MYTFDSRIRYSETDETGNLSLTGIADYFQDCSTFQSEDLDMGISYLSERGKAWWLSSWQIVIERYPKLGERIVVGTWPYDFKGFYGYRNFVIRDSAGKDLVKANSVWFFFDIELGRPVKITQADIRGYQTGIGQRLSMEYADRKIAVPGQYDTVKEVVAARHHIDTNHHVNNARYVEIVLEALPPEFQAGELRMEYKQAAVRGEVIIPQVSHTDKGYIVTLASHKGGQYAVAELRGMRG